LALVLISLHYIIKKSEGPGLSKSDEKAYWGKIEECNVENIKEVGIKWEENENTKRIEIKGTIFWGWGLEPGESLN
jgi:hypothetical protein